MISDEIKLLCFQESQEYFLSHGLNGQRMSVEEVLAVLDEIPEDQWEDGKTFFDPGCGEGEFLIAVLIVKKALGHQRLLDTIHGMEIDLKNIELCKDRILNFIGNTQENRNILDENIFLLGSEGKRYSPVVGRLLQF